MIGFDKFFITSILSELMIEELYHTVTILRGLIPFILLDYHYILLDITGRLWTHKDYLEIDDLD